MAVSPPETKMPNMNDPKMEMVPIPRPAKSGKAFWVIGLLILAAALVLLGKGFLNIKGPGQSPSLEISNKTLAELKSEATLTFPEITSRKELLSANLSPDVTIFLDSSAPDLKTELLNYSDPVVLLGFYASYTSAGSAEDIYNLLLTKANSKAWYVGYSKSSSKAAILEAEKNIGGTIYRVQATLENQDNGKVKVIVQYAVTPQKKQ